MGINSFNSDESIDLSAPLNEKPSEQYSENAKKAQIQLKKIQKDEKKAQNDDQKLFLILNRFITDSYYESLIGDIIFLLQLGIPSRVVTAFIALFYPDATFYIADFLGKKEKINLLLSLPKNPELQDFDENNVDDAIAQWIREWIILMELFLISSESSLLVMKKTGDFFSGKEKIQIVHRLANLIIFFLQGRNIKMSREIAEKYATFIIQNIQKHLQIYLQSQNQQVQELLEDATMNADNLFGKL